MNDLNDADKALLELAREGHEPTGVDRSRVRAAIALQLGLGASLVATSAGAGGVAAAGTSFVAVAAKVLVVTAVIGGLTGAASVAYRSSRPAATVAPGAATSAPHETQAILAPRPSVAPPLSTAATAPAAPQPLVEPVTAPDVRPVPVRRSPEVLSPPVYAKASVPSIADSVRSAPSLEPSPLQTATSPRLAATSDPVLAAAPSTAPPLAPTTLEAETHLVGAGVTALHAGDPARALTLFDEHARQFPAGALAQERMVERIAALCALGRRDDAQSAAALFLQLHGGSPLVERVRASCGGVGSIP